MARYRSAGRLGFHRLEIVEAEVGQQSVHELGGGRSGCHKAFNDRAFDGAFDSAVDGRFDGTFDWTFDGTFDGIFDGMFYGTFDGTVDGTFDWTFDGPAGCFVACSIWLGRSVSMVPPVLTMSIVHYSTFTTARTHACQQSLEGFRRGACNEY